jgi:hypothetical protein
VGAFAITPDHTTRLTKFVTAWVAGGGTEDVIVHGYASTLGTDATNWILSCQRAEAVQAELIRLGIPAAKVAVLAHGETSEFSASRDPNQRVVVASRTSPSPTPPPPPSPTPPAVRTVKVWVHSFIPMASVVDPFGYCYAGDSRGFSNAIHASYRTHQEIEFDVTTGKPLIDWSDTGTTHELDSTCTRVIGVAKASTAGLINAVVSHTPTKFDIAFVGSAKNPRAWYACDIDLNLTVSVDTVARTCTVSGAHDGFPAYEVYVTANGGAGVTAYTYDPVAAGEGPTALCGGLDKTAAGTAAF